MSIPPKLSASVLLLVSVVGVIVLVLIFRAWLQPSITLILLEGLFLCR